MRGKAKCGSDNVSVQGITPAYAGKRGFFRLCRLQCGDHPRLCGEKIKDEIRLNEAEGSPPPMRGKA